MQEAGYFALVITILFCIVGYEKETFGSSLFYPDIPKGRNQCLHRFTHISFWFEWSEYRRAAILVNHSTSLTRRYRSHPRECAPCHRR